jgi:type I restriction enzyme S subunit
MRDVWVEYKFKDVATAVKGKLPKSKNEDGIGIPYLTASYLRSSKPDYWIQNLDGAVTAEDGDCLILWDGAGAGDLFSAYRGVVSSTMAVVTTQNSKILREFLTLFISSKADYIKETCRGTTVPHVSPDAIANMDLKIPPLPEQKRIIDLISSVDSYIEAFKKQLKNAKKSRNAVLHELLTAGGDDWIKTTLEEIAEVIMGQSPDGKSYNEKGEGLPFMQGSAEFGEHHPTPEKWCSDPKKIAGPGDLLLSVRAPVGDTNFANQRIAVGRGLSVIRAKSNSLNEFIRYVIQLNVAEMIASSGTGMFASITGKNLKQFKVLLPPLLEQKRIVEIILSMDKVVDQTQEAIDKAQNLRSGLLSDLLSGEHEIPASYDKVMGAA